MHPAVQRGEGGLDLVMLYGAMIAVLAGGAPVAGIGEGPPLIWTFDRRPHSGSSQLGLACLPSGRFALGDIAVPDYSMLRQTLGAGIAAEIVGMEASLCGAYMGMGKGPSSRISLQVRWHVDGQPCGSAVSSKTRMKNADLRFDKRVFAEALEASFKIWQREGAQPAHCQISMRSD